MKKSIQTLKKEITSANTVVKISEELNRDFGKVTGIAILDNVPEKSEFISSFIDGNEVVPKNFEVRFFQTDKSVSADKRFFTIHDFKAAGNKIDLEFKDGGGAVNYPYTLNIYLRLENDKN